MKSFGMPYTRWVQDAAKSVNYYYDNLGRLTKAETQDLTAANTYRLEWAYDRYGNRLSQSLTGGSISTTAPQLTVDATTNRITTAGYAYDAAGNLTNDTLHTYAYDAENRIKTLDGVSAGHTSTNLLLRYPGSGHLQPGHLPRTSHLWLRRRQRLLPLA